LDLILFLACPPQILDCVAHIEGHVPCDLNTLNTGWVGCVMRRVIDGVVGLFLYEVLDVAGCQFDAEFGIINEGHNVYATFVKCSEGFSVYNSFIFAVV
jgi:hypothetical protein